MSRKRTADLDNVDGSNNDLLQITPTTAAGKRISTIGNIEVLLKRIQFARQRRFRLDDHLFQMSIITTNRRPPRLVSILTNIKAGIVDALLQLQQLYTKDDHHQIYLTIDDVQFRGNGINTGNYNLFGDNDQTAYLKSVAQDAMDILANCLRSYDHIKLDESFTILIRVLSVAHMHEKRQVGRLRPVKQLAGAAEDTLIKNKMLYTGDKVIFVLPNFEELQSGCVISAVILGFYYRKHLRNLYNGDFSAEAKFFRKISKIRYPTSPLFSEAKAGRA